jgi:hypothetical protein
VLEGAAAVERRRVGGSGSQSAGQHGACERDDRGEA